MVLPMVGVTRERLQNSLDIKIRVGIKMFFLLSVRPVEVSFKREAYVIDSKTPFLTLESCCPVA